MAENAAVEGFTRGPLEPFSCIVGAAIIGNFGPYNLAFFSVISVYMHVVDIESSQSSSIGTLASTIS